MDLAACDEVSLRGLQFFEKGYKCYCRGKTAIAINSMELPGPSQQNTHML